MEQKLEWSMQAMEEVAGRRTVKGNVLLAQEEIRREAGGAGKRKRLCSSPRISNSPWAGQTLLVRLFL